MMHASSDDAETSQLLLPPSAPPSSQSVNKHQESNNNNSNHDRIIQMNRFATAEQRRRRATYDAVQQSVQEMMLQQQQQQSINNPKQNRRQTAKRIVQKGLRSARDTIQKVNIGRWIDDLEHDQQIANDLDRINHDLIEEEERKKLVAHVHRLCMNAIQDHLMSFLNEHPHGTYEEWIAELHPENVIITMNHKTTTDNDMYKNSDDPTMSDAIQSFPKPQIDPRFYVPDSDHLLLWRERQHLK